MTRVLLTGVAGFIGAHTLQHILEATDWTVVGVDSWRHKGTPERIEQVLSKNPAWRTRLQIVTHDLSAPFTGMTRKLIGPCDYILNVASDSHVDRSIAEPAQFVENNVGIALTTLEFARENPCRAFVQISTDEVYGPATDGETHREWSPIIPSNPYSASKAAQEAIAISYWRTYGIPLIITNTMNNFGEMQDPEKFMAKILRCLMSGDPVPVHGRRFDDGRVDFGSRCYLHARNHADALLFLLRKGAPSPYSGRSDDKPDRYNIVGEELSNLAVAELIAGMVEVPLKYDVVDFHSTRPGHDRRYALDGSKIAALGWRAPVNLQDSLRHYIRWTLDHPVWL
jgi:dTDP-glucose 4,6-dehydratase